MITAMINQITTMKRKVGIAVIVFNRRNHKILL